MAASKMTATMAALLCTIAIAQADTKRSTFKVTGRARSTSSICGGGAAVTEERIAQLPPPMPLSGLGLLAVAGTSITSKRPTARATTNKAGAFTMNLPRGTWCIFRADRALPADAPSDGPRAAPKPGGGAVDEECLEAERRRCDAVITVKKAMTNVDLDFPNGCSETWNQPCYHGPMPP